MGSKDFVLPNGGWGWMVVVGVALTNMFNQSIISLFGLLFGEHLNSMGQGTFGAALVMNLNSVALNFSGLITGPALKAYSPRTVAIVGSILTGVGLILSSFSTSLWQITLSYGLLVGIGLGLINPSSFIAVNSYFSTRRGRAVGLALAGTGVGQMVMPHMVRILLDFYGFRGTILIMGALSFNGIVGASLFQPVEWHIRPLDDSCDENKMLLKVTKNGTARTTGGGGDTSQASTISSTINHLNSNNHHNHHHYHQHHHNNHQASSSSSAATATPATATTAAAAAATIGLGIGNGTSAATITTSSSSFSIPPRRSSSVMFSDTDDDDDDDEDVEIYRSTTEFCTKDNERLIHKLTKTTFCSRISRAMDLQLLKDSVFCSIAIGLALAYTASINFSMIFPYFLQETAGLNRSDTALCMSILAAADLASRLTLPTITDKLKVSCRMIFLIGAILLACTRATLAETFDRNKLIIMSAIYGYVRAATVVNQNLTISEYTSQDKLASALGLNMVAKGFFVITLGQFLGWIRDFTGSYPVCLHAQNVLLIIVIIMWTPEIVHRKYKAFLNRRNKERCPVDI